MFTPDLVIMGAVAVVSFVIVFVTGWVYTRDSSRTVETNVKWLVALVITLGWILATGAGIFITGYTVSPLLHALMGAIVGYFFTDNGINFNIGGNDGNK